MPETIRETRLFLQEMNANIKEREFLLNGVLKESFGTVIQKYPTIFTIR